MKTLFIILLLSLCGCSHVIQRLSVKDEKTSVPFQEVHFEKIDLNDDGIIDEQEFSEASKSKTINIKTPIITGVVILSAIFLMLYLIKIKNKK